MSGFDEETDRKKGVKPLGTLSPDPWDFTALVPIPVSQFKCWEPTGRRPQLGLGPGVGAQAASRQSLILRSGQL